MPRALVLQNSPLEGPGLLGSLLAGDGYELRTVDARLGSIPRDGFGLLVVLGGPQGANDDAAYLREEESLMRSCSERDIPVIGICLGAQLLARSLGARVWRAERPEIGFYGDLVPDVAGGIMAGFASPFAAFHWHNDAFGLPEGATRLAHSASCENQAFVSGRSLGVQFHLEVGQGMVRSWADAAEGAAGGISRGAAESIRADAPSRMRAVGENMRRLYANMRSEFGL